MSLKLHLFRLWSDQHCNVPLSLGKFSQALSNLFNYSYSISSQKLFFKAASIQTFWWRWLSKSRHPLMHEGMNMSQVWYMFFRVGTAGAGLLKCQLCNIKHKHTHRHAEAQWNTHPHVQIFPEVSKPISYATHGQVLDAAAPASNCWTLKHH